MDIILVTKAENMNAVSKILNHPKVHGFITDDTSDSHYTPNAEDFYIINKAETGVVKLDQLNGVTCIVHIAALPELWGKGVDFARESIDWGFKNTRFSKVVAIVPEFNHLTIKLCVGCGFEKEGLIKKSFLKNWEFHNQIIFGLTKAQFYKGE
jgi:RimJ/RimL family protein N-acetyltransferase